MTRFNPITITEKYDEVSCLESLNERREFLNKQSDEMKVALWLKNIDRKTEGIELSSEQKELLDIIKKKFITAEYIRFAKGKSEEEAGPEYIEIMSKASRLLGNDNLRELFVIMGDSNTLKPIC